MQLIRSLLLRKHQAESSELHDRQKQARHLPSCILRTAQPHKAEALLLPPDAVCPQAAFQTM